MCRNRCTQKVSDVLHHHWTGSPKARDRGSAIWHERSGVGAIAGVLLERGCTEVVMESTESYWKPIFNVLEDKLRVKLTNAEKVKALRVKKTDPIDCRWLASCFGTD